MVPVAPGQDVPRQEGRAQAYQDGASQLHPARGQHIQECPTPGNILLPVLSKSIYFYHP